jgi:osmoprotectant transport system permease protein
MLVNAYVGVAEVDGDLREAARGMGMTGWEALRRVELPLALPLVMAGIRTGAVQVVATATLAAYIGEGGLGRYIVDGQSVQDNVTVFAGALVVAFLSVGTELGLGAIQHAVTPRGRDVDLADAVAAH